MEVSFANFTRSMEQGPQKEAIRKCFTLLTQHFPCENAIWRTTYKLENPKRLLIENY